MKIRHHFPRPIGRRHPAWWAPLGIVFLSVVGGLILAACAVLLYTNPLTVVYGVSTVTGHQISIASGQDPKAGGSYTKIELPLSGDRNLVGKYQSLHWLNTHTLELDDVALGDFFFAKKVVLAWSWKYVFRNHRLSLIDLDHPEFFIGKMQASFPPSAEDTAADKDPFQTMRHIFYKIRVTHGIIWIDTLGEGVPALPLVIGGHVPFEWNTGSLTKETAEEEQIKIAETSGIRLYSPLDPQVPVLDLGRLQIGFTWEGLAKRQIESLAITGPTIFIGPNLFVFSDAFKHHKQGAVAATVSTGGSNAGPTAAASAVPASAPAATVPPAAAPAKAGWVIHNFVLYNGHLRITAFGEPGIGLPFTFRSSAQDLDLSHIDQLNLHNQINVDGKVLDYPEYKLRLTDVTGKIEFGLPIQDEAANNLVHTIQVGEVSWNEIVARKAWTSITFDKSGIYGSLGGEVYGGYLQGDAGILFGNGFPWHAGLYISNTELQEPVKRLAGEHFDLRGKVNLNLTVEAKARTIVKSEAHAVFVHGGRMEIPSVDAVAAKLPADWAPWRKTILENILGSFRNYDFDSGNLSFQYGLPTSTAQLNLEGSQGRRNFILNWTQENGEGVALPSQTPPKFSVKIDRP